MTKGHKPREGSSKISSPSKNSNLPANFSFSCNENLDESDSSEINNSKESLEHSPRLAHSTSDNKASTSGTASDLSFKWSNDSSSVGLRKKPAAANESVIIARTVHTVASNMKETEFREKSKSTSSNASNSNSNWQPLVLFAIVCVTFICYYVFSIFSTYSLSGSSTSFVEGCSGGRQGAACRFISELDYLKSSYDKQIQNKRLWKVINATVKAVLNEDPPTKPAILLLTSNNSNMLDKFGQALATTVAASYDPNFRGYYTELNRHISASYKDDDLKETYDTIIANDVEKNEYDVIIVPHTEMLTGKVALLWHGYCDHENAQYKDIAIIFTVALPPEQTVTDDTVDTAVEKYLETKWSQGLGGNDNFGALWSRIGGSVAIVE